MKLSNKTLGVLRNLAVINPNLVFKEGNRLQTISEMKNILATVNIEETIPQQFGIYDLNAFLSVVGMFDEPELVFDDHTKVRITGSESRSSVNYFFSSPENLTSPKKSIAIPSVDGTFKLSTQDLADLRKAASTLKSKDLVISEGVATLCDLKDSTSNTFQLELEDCNMPEGSKVIFNIDNLKLLPSNYQVNISNKMLAQFIGDDCEYFIAVERNSTF